MTGLSDVEGSGPTYAEKLAAAGLDTVEQLLAAGGTPEGRAASESQVAGWIEQAKGLDRAVHH